MSTPFLLQRDRDRPADVREPERRDAPDDDDGRILVCAACLQAVTTTSARIEMSGGHAHTFSNPHGIVFHIGCFAVAPGCGVASESSTLHTWFPGYAWQIAVCRGCGEHLGWLFRSGDSCFHGLIFDRLAETEGSAH
jgi:hypothetical protein